MNRPTENAPQSVKALTPRQLILLGLGAVMLVSLIVFLVGQTMDTQSADGFPDITAGYFLFFLALLLLVLSLIAWTYLVIISCTKRNTTRYTKGSYYRLLLFPYLPLLCLVAYSMYKFFMPYIVHYHEASSLAPVEMPLPSGHQIVYARIERHNLFVLLYHRNDKVHDSICVYKSVKYPHFIQAGHYKDFIWYLPGNPWHLVSQIPSALDSMKPQPSVIRELPPPTREMSAGFSLLNHHFTVYAPQVLTEAIKIPAFENADRFQSVYMYANENQKHIWVMAYPEGQSMYPKTLWLARISAGQTQLFDIPLDDIAKPERLAGQQLRGIFYHQQGLYILARSACLMIPVPDIE